ncbi:hypothetical protein C6A37_05555 [Desulfobacteraceae bacterium SEEP-SAG9]|nr:hypothetical protein C6A37_05555 [Desulfobacteraceae bacterium SEEP-SAG9]
MDKQKKVFSTKEFSSLTGMPVSLITKLLRERKLEGKKASGKWIIFENQLQSKCIQEMLKDDNSTKIKKTYSVNEFAEMTYLTAFGVKQWLKKGLLIVKINTEGVWQVDAESLEIPNVKRLVRD